jgi:hypothetical protein
MQTANIILDIGGDVAVNSVPKYNVTAAEIAVLIAIHGDDAISDIEPTGSVDRSNREERARLYEVYGHAKDREDKPIVAALFPGAAARVFEDIEELGLPETAFRATSRAKPSDPLDHDGDGKKGGVKGRKAKAKVETVAEPEPPVEEPAETEENDGVEDMPDGDTLFK